MDRTERNQGSEELAEMEPELDNDNGNDPINDEGTDPSNEPSLDVLPQDTDPTPPAGNDPAQTQPRAEPEAKVLQIPSNSMKRIKEEERKRGRDAAIAELNAEARKLGYQSHAAMMQELQRQRSQPSKQSQQPARTDAASTESPRKLNALEREVARLQDERKRQNRRVAELEKENKRLKAQLDEKDAEIALRVAAAKSGVQDIEYALHVLRQTVRGKSEDELKTFSEERFFGETLRTTHPYLYGVETRPANSSPAPAEPAGTPEPPKVEPPKSDHTGPVDARKLSPAEYQELLRRRGITDPNVSSFAG